MSDKNPLLPDPQPEEDPAPEIVGDRRFLKVPTVAKRLMFRTQMDTPYRPGEIFMMSGNRRYQACDQGKTLRRIKAA
jgi:hypothetical protein